MSDRPTDPLSALRKLRAHRDRWGLRHVAGSPLYDTAVRQLAAIGSRLAPYAAIDAGLVGDAR